MHRIKFFINLLVVISELLVSNLIATLMQLNGRYLIAYMDAIIWTLYALG